MLSRNVGRQMVNSPLKRAEASPIAAGALDRVEKTAINAAKAAGRVLRGRFGRAGKVSLKSTPIDLVSEADLEAQAAIFRIIQERFPSDSILSEETRGRPALAQESLWVVDPLDGTTNFTHTFPQFCVSIAYLCRAVPVVGVVYDPLRDELFHARRGQGARLNRGPVRVSAVRSLAQALLATGFPYDRRRRADFYLAFWKAFMMRVQGTRRAGAAALDLAYVACGRLDGFWEFGLKAWDVAAGALLVEEAGGRATNMDGSALRLDAGNILATNGWLHRPMMAVLKRTLRSFGETPVAQWP
jgi:myo-inositol-1(or 4)-monophosphatase